MLGNGEEVIRADRTIHYSKEIGLVVLNEQMVCCFYETNAILIEIVTTYYWSYQKKRYEYFLLESTKEPDIYLWSMERNFQTVR